MPSVGQSHRRSARASVCCPTDRLGLERGGHVALPISRRATAVLATALALSPLATSAALAATAGNDAYSVDEDQQLVVPLAPDVPSLLANDTVDSGTPCVISVEASTLQGTLDTSLITGGAFTY